MSLSPPNMIFDYKSCCTPNYEGRAMAFIVVVLKILFGLDGITEYEISRVAEKINRFVSYFQGVFNQDFKDSQKLKKVHKDF